MDEFPTTRLLFSVASNDVEWVGSYTDMVTNSLLELHQYDSTHYTQILSRFVVDNPSVYGKQESAPGFDINHLKRIWTTWYEWYNRDGKGLDRGEILAKFVRSLQRVNPVILSLPANMQHE